MISANADFIEQEQKQVLRPYFDLFFSPYPYPCKISDGTFVNCVLESAGGYLPGEGEAGYGGFGDFGLGDSPWGYGASLVEDLTPAPSGIARIIIIYGSVSASWTSPVITNPAEIMPATPTPTWLLNKPGYSVVMQYRTSNNVNQLPYLSWSTLTEDVAVSLYRYYQLKFVWTMIRAWFTDSLAAAEANPNSFYFTDAGVGDHASYFCEGDGEISYLQDLKLTGEYQANPDDVADMGEFSEELGEDFGKVIVGEHTAVLINRDNKFTEGHANYFLQEDPDVELGVRISMGYERGAATPINLYKGEVKRWGPRPVSIDPDGKVAEATVEVYSKSIIAKLLDTQIGLTDDDGIPHPFVCGEILHELVQLADETLNEPEKTVMAVADFSATQILGTNNTLTDNTTETVKGMDSIKCRVESGGGPSGQGAIGYLDLSLFTNKLLLSAWIMFKEIPATINNNGTNFFGFQKADGTTQFYLTVGFDTRVNVGIGAEVKETSWYLNQDPGVWKRVSIGYAGLPDIGGDHYGIAKIWLNGEEVFSQTDGDFTLWSSMRRGMAGCWDSFAGETWEIYFADIQITPGWEPYAYRLYGAPYKSLGTVYQDGAIQLDTKKITTPGSWAAPQTFKDYLQPTYIPGTVVDQTLISKNARQGTVIFTDYANPPSGTLMIRARKDDNTHPAQVFELLLETANLAYAVNASSFAACLAALPDDVIGCWFEDLTVADAMAAVGSHCLINILGTLDTVRLLPYLGVAGTPVATVENWSGYEHSMDKEGQTSRVKTKWGWYERNKLLTYIAKDDVAFARVGQKDIEIDFSWGQEVASDSEKMAHAKTDNLLKRVRGSKKGCKELLENFVTPYTHARLEVGDTITVTSDDLFNTPNFLITKKTMKLSPDYELSFEGVKFLGE